mmetsp:Transcript_10894/g.30139  ORF Transcript_10894/g.30139 Transcript_10894/m.30139 type:complete len:594 (+) Transcript_10894:517-2298(+)|eukprot:CAMPEP_0168722842 /NCGR_PEP_ID=MMETSP0724-20121128/2806_1 /TAXON_ID=265536 /ORGANISM="Amphiprora sp., Strain CCMP467" /LENGTH=593 /DNA_ID=CAMNT_0008769527 /DNA_START=477 /DNA_END=2258 /DNA_ORIENTATION=-
MQGVSIQTSPFAFDARYESPPATKAYQSASVTTQADNGGEFGDASSSSSRARALMDTVVTPFLTCVKKSNGSPTPPTTSSYLATASEWSTPNHARASKFATPSPSILPIGSNNTSPRRPIPPPFAASHPSVHSPSKSPYVSNHADQQVSPSTMSTDAPIMHVNDNDVLCGRGGGNGCSHIGNARFRELVASQREYYSTLTKKQKMILSRQIVNLIRKVGGRFLARDHSNGVVNGSKGLSPTGQHHWYDIGLPRSFEKTAQALREKSKSKNDTPGNEENSCCDSSTECQSDITVKQTNTSPKEKSCKSMKPPKLVVPSHLRDIYGSAPTSAAADRDHASNQSDTMPAPPARPFFRSAPHPMPCHDFHYRSLAPAASLSPIFPSIHSTPPSTTAIHFRDDWHQQHVPPTKIHTLRAPSSSRLQNNVPASHFADPTNHRGTVHVDHSINSSVGKYLSRQALGDGKEAVRAPHSNDTLNSPTRSPTWKRPRVVSRSPDSSQMQAPMVFSHSLVSDTDVPMMISHSDGNSETSSETSLSLEQRVIRAPTSPPQGLVNEKLVPPSQITSRHRTELSSDQDGLAALSTAAFLRLDEEFGM